ncbi:hypothetical protein F862_gp075 [Vibrio phage vB_VpaS_MAR10]|uniref:Uncharacterized protein n=1 Tax=Vibrio phage vB_VpaS_MAR10 TaxID=1229755 RepID=K7RFN9_9CAUD|nr:hypothetical protein F862_gp075 [Vibrio phage vB_VpaS_MAR10]AFV81307.1 hypothetical protein MAR10_073 [Vibrio phage vB_VpaS_MAR10]
MSRRDRNSRGGRKGFEYKKRSKEQVQKRADQSSGDFKSIFKDGIKLFKPKKGDNAIRILPATWEDPDHYALDVHVHYGVGADEERVLALHEMLGEDDPIREMRMDYEQAGNKEMAKACRPGRACAMWVIDLDNEAEGPQMYLAPPTVDAGIAQVSIDKRSGEMYDIDDPDNGYEVYFTKQGEGMNTKYVGFQISRNPSEVDEEHLDYAIENPIPDCLVYLEYDEIAKMIDGWEPTPRGKGGKDGGKEKPKSYRGRDRDRGDDADDSRSRRGGSDDSKSGGDRGEGDYQYDDVMAADWEELEQIIELEELDIDPMDFDEDDQEGCAKAICEELGIEKPKPTRSARGGSRRSRGGDSDDGDSRSSRRRGRGDDGDDSSERVRGMRRNRR